MEDEDPRRQRQREVIRKAVEEGYFEVPRKISLVELSDQLGTSDKEAFRELNRALDQYLRETLLEKPS